MNDRRLFWLQLIAVLLLAANLGATFYFGLSKSSTKANSSTPLEASEQVSEKDAEKLIREVVDLYNSNNIRELYLKFDDIARIQFTEQKLTEEIAKLRTTIGKVDEYAYMSTEFAGKEAGRTYVSLNYKARLTDSPFTKGSIRVTVTKKDGKLTLLGFFLNGQSMSSQ